MFTHRFLLEELTEAYSSIPGKLPPLLLPLLYNWIDWLSLFEKHLTRQLSYDKIIMLSSFFLMKRVCACACKRVCVIGLWGNSSASVVIIPPRKHKAFFTLGYKHNLYL